MCNEINTQKKKKKKSDICPQSLFNPTFLQQNTSGGHVAELFYALMAIKVKLRTKESHMVGKCSMESFMQADFKI